MAEKAKATRRSPKVALLIFLTVTSGVISYALWKSSGGPKSSLNEIIFCIVRGWFNCHFLMKIVAICFPGAFLSAVYWAFWQPVWDEGVIAKQVFDIAAEKVEGEFTLEPEVKESAWKKFWAKVFRTD